MAEERSEFEATWAIRAVDKLTAQLEDARHAQGNPDWVARKLEECLTEGVRRLKAFPVCEIVMRLTDSGVTL